MSLKKFFVGAMFALTLVMVVPNTTLTVHAGFSSEDEGGSSDSGDSGSSDSGNSGSSDSGNSGSSDSGNSGSSDSGNSGSSDSGNSGSSDSGDSGSSDSGDSGSSDSGDSGSSDSGDSGSSDSGDSGSSDSGNSGSSDSGNSGSSDSGDSDDNGNNSPETPSDNPSSEPTTVEPSHNDGNHDNGGSHHSDNNVVTAPTAEEVPAPEVVEEILPVLPIVEEPVVIEEPVIIEEKEEVRMAAKPEVKEEVYSCANSGICHVAEKPEEAVEVLDDTTETVVTTKEENVNKGGHFIAWALLFGVVMLLLFVLCTQYHVVLITEDNEELYDDKAPLIGFRRIAGYVGSFDFDNDEALAGIQRVEIRNRYRAHMEPEQDVVYAVTREGEEYTVYCSRKEGIILYDELDFNYKPFLNEVAEYELSPLT